MPAGDYAAVKKDIAAILKKPDWDDGHLGPVLGMVEFATAIFFELYIRNLQ
jgi:deoxyxylulose-5-phosphate synthase